MTKLELELENEALRGRVLELAGGGRRKWHVDQREDLLKKLETKEIKADVGKAMLAVLESLARLDVVGGDAKEEPEKVTRKAVVRNTDLSNLLQFGK